MSYTIKTNTSSRTGLENKNGFWKEHKSVSLNRKDLSTSGIPLDVREDRVAFSNPETHCMVCGASGKGKTRRILYPTVLMSARAGRSMVIADMKGEIYRNTAAEVQRCGHNIKVINLRQPRCGNRFSPLSLAKRYWDNGDRSRATILLKDIAAIIMSSIRSDRDKFWEMSAQDAFIGFALLLLEKGSPLTFENIHNLFNEFFTDKEMRKSDFFDVEADSYKRLSTLVKLESDNTLSCIVSECNSALSSYVDQEDVREMLSDSDLELTDIGRRPTAVFIICPDESTSLYGIASLFVEQCYSELINYADNSSENKLPVNVDFLLDEFGSFVGSDWPSKLTAARSRGIRFILAIQALSQLVERYGENGARTIMANCRTLVYMGGRDMKLMSEISLISGYRIDERTGFDRPVLSINDLCSLKTGQIIVLDDSPMPYVGYLPDWADWGIESKTEGPYFNRKKSTDGPVNLRSLLGVTDPGDDEDFEKYF